jgi:hypothetical protein
MSDYDFSGLSPRQQWLILYQGWRIGQRFPDGSPWPQPNKRTVKKLIERGLMTEFEAVYIHDDRTRVTVTEYRVPLHVHMAFCMSCDFEEPANV